MAQQHRDETAGAVLSAHLQEQATAFLRSLRLHRESGSDAEEAAEAARALRRSARRIGGALHTFRPLTDGAWADHLRTELAWLTATLGREHTYATRLERLLTALNRLSGTGPVAAPPVPATEFASGASGRSADGLLRAAGGGPHTGGGRPNASGGAPAAVTAGLGGAGDAGGTPAGPAPARAGRGRGAAGHAAGAAAGTGRAAARDDGAPTGALTVGAARAGALLERQLTLARTRSHSAALQALGSSRFHAVADAVALLASEVPLGPAAGEAPERVLPPLAEEVERQLDEAVAALPLVRAGHPYNADALVHGLAATPAADSPPASELQDAPWHQVRRQLRLHRYTREVLAGTEGEGTPDVRLVAAGQALERHRDAAEAAAAAASAARTPRIAPATAYALGVLHADQRHEVEAARFAFYRIWERTAVNVP